MTVSRTYHTQDAKLPRFTVHPADSYIIRGKSAGMECEAVGADKAYFVCNGEAMSSSASSKGNGGAAQHETARVDAGTGAETRALTLEVISGAAVRYCESKIQNQCSLITSPITTERE